MPLEQQVAFFREAVNIEKQWGIPIGHETHRGRTLFNPWDAGTGYEIACQRST